MANRKKLPVDVKMLVLTEAGYRCAVPTCRTILALDLHHMVEVADGGADAPANLLALCPTCHALYHRGEIARESIYVWKQILLSLNAALDQRAIDDLLFLYELPDNALGVSGDGVLEFRRLIAAGLAGFKLLIQNGPMLVYQVGVTKKGQMLVEAWKKGDRTAVQNALGR